MRGPATCRRSMSLPTVQITEVRGMHYEGPHSNLVPIKLSRFRLSLRIENIIVGAERCYGPSDPSYGIYISSDQWAARGQKFQHLTVRSGLSWSSGLLEGMLVGTGRLWCIPVL